MNISILHHRHGHTYEPEITCTCKSICLKCGNTRSLVALKYLYSWRQLIFLLQRVTVIGLYSWDDPTISVCGKVK
jgi:hypothetical protein